MSNAEFVSWACFVVGTVILIAGVVIGLVLGFTSQAKGAGVKDATAKVKDALGKVGELQTTAVNAAKTPATDEAAAKDAGDKGGDAQGLLKEVEGIIGALPEKLRFSGLLVLIGALLMSVATVQFGGHPIF